MKLKIFTIVVLSFLAMEAFAKQIHVFACGDFAVVTEEPIITQTLPKGIPCVKTSAEVLPEFPTGLHKRPNMPADNQWLWNAFQYLDHLDTINPDVICGEWSNIGEQCPWNYSE